MQWHVVRTDSDLCREVVNSEQEDASVLVHVCINALQVGISRVGACGAFHIGRAENLLT